MPHASHARSKSFFDVSPTPSPVKTPVRSPSSPISRFMRSSSSTNMSSKSLAPNLSTNKSSSFSPSSPNFMQRILSSSGPDNTTEDTRRTSHFKSLSDLSNPTLGRKPRDKNESSSSLTAPRRRRKSSSLPSPRAATAMTAGSPISMYDDQEDPFRYSAGGVFSQLSPSPNPKRRGAVPSATMSSSKPLETGRDAQGRLRSKSSPNIVTPLRYNSRDSTAPLNLPKRSQSGRLVASSGTRHSELSALNVSAPPLPLNSASKSLTSPTMSLRTAVALKDRNSPRPNGTPRREGAATNSSVRSNLETPSMGLFPLVVPNSPKRVFTPAAAPPRNTSEGAVPLSPHIRNMLSHTSSDGNSFNIIARYTASKQSPSPLRSPESTKTSFLDLSPAQSLHQHSPTTTAKSEPRIIPGRRAARDGLRPKLHQGPFDPHAISLTNSSPARALLDHTVLSSRSQVPPPNMPSGHMEVRPSVSEESFTGGIFVNSVSMETVSDMTLDGMSVISSSIESLGSPVLDTRLSKEVATIKEDDDDAPWLSVTPPSPIKNPAKRRGFIYRSSLMAPLTVHRTPSPEPGTISAESAGEAVKMEDTVLTASDHDDDDDSYSDVSEILEEYYDALDVYETPLDTSSGTIRPGAEEGICDESLTDLDRDLPPRPLTPLPARSYDSPSGRQYHSRRSSASSTSSSSSAVSITSYYQTPLSTTLQLGFLSPASSSINITFEDSPPEPSAYSAHALGINSQNAIERPPSRSSSLDGKQVVSLPNSVIVKSSPPHPLPVRNRTPSPSPSHLSFIPPKSSPLAFSSSFTGSTSDSDGEENHKSLPSPDSSHTRLGSTGRKWSGRIKGMFQNVRANNSLPTSPSMSVTGITPPDFGLDKETSYQAGSDDESKQSPGALKSRLSVFPEHSPTNKGRTSSAGGLANVGISLKRVTKKV